MYNTDTDNWCNSHCIRALSRQQEMFLKPIYLDLYDDPPDRSTMHEWSTGGQVMADNGQCINIRRPLMTTGDSTPQLAI